MTADIPAAFHNTWACWKERLKGKRGCGFFCPSEEMERPSAAVWWEVEARPCTPALPSGTRPLQSSCVWCWALSLLQGEVPHADQGGASEPWGEGQRRARGAPARLPRLLRAPGAARGHGPVCAGGQGQLCCSPTRDLPGTWEERQEGPAGQVRLPGRAVALPAHGPLLPSPGWGGRVTAGSQVQPGEPFLDLWHLPEEPWMAGDSSQRQGHVDHLLEGPSRGRAVRGCALELWKQEEAFCIEGDLPKVWVTAGAQICVCLQACTGLCYTPAQVTALWHQAQPQGDPSEPLVGLCSGTEIQLHPCHGGVTAGGRHGAAGWVMWNFTAVHSW